MAAIGSKEQLKALVEKVYGSGVPAHVIDRDISVYWGKDENEVMQSLISSPSPNIAEWARNDARLNEYGPVGVTSGAVSGGGSAAIDFAQYVAPAEKMIAPYYDQLLIDAKGDWEMVKNFLKKDFEFYLGQGDERMAAFIKTVASEAEKRQGTIQYDFEKAKTRAEENYKLATDRLSTEETAWKEQEAFTAEKAKESRMGGYLDRLGGTGTMESGVIGKAEQEAEKARQFQVDTYNRTLTQKREDLLQTKERGLQDITDEARRKIYEAQKVGEGGETYEKTAKQYEDITREKTGTIAMERQQAKQSYINWLAQAGIKNVDAFIS